MSVHGTGDGALLDGAHDPLDHLAELRVVVARGVVDGLEDVVAVVIVVATEKYGIFLPPFYCALVDPCFLQ